MRLRAEDPYWALGILALFVSLKHQVFIKLVVVILAMGSVLEENPPVQPNEENGTEVLPGLRIKADGTVVRNSDRALPTTDPSVSPSPIFVDSVASKDVIVDSETGIWGRVFLPESVSEGLSKKLPIVVYFHGGGFCMGDAGDVGPSYQSTRLCKTANVVVLSASYRLSPEIRLPLAFNDAYTTMSWLQKQCKYQASGETTAGDPWLMSHVDFSQVFVMGLSAGGNIAHHLVVSKPLKDFRPLTIAGVIPMVPFFGAEELSESEEKFREDEILPLGKHHTFWRLALPVAANRDHPFCNPLSADAQRLTEVEIPRMLLIVAGKDPLFSRQMEYYNALKQAGKEVQLVEVHEGGHLFRIAAALDAENVRVDQVTSNFIHKARLA